MPSAVPSDRYPRASSSSLSSSLTSSPRLPRCRLFPYTTLFRSVGRGRRECRVAMHERRIVAARVHALLAQHGGELVARQTDRKSTRLNSSHANISYAVFCLKKKKRDRKLKTLSTERTRSRPITT